MGDLKKKGEKFDAGKVRVGLVPMRAVWAVAEVLTTGAETHGDNNWQGVEPFEERYANALLRHLLKWKMGEKFDKDSGRLHMSHVATNALFLLSKEVGFDP